MTHAVTKESISKLFCLARSPVLPAEDWLTIQIGDRFLSRGPELPIQKIEVDGDEALLLGWPAARQDGSHYDRKSLGELGGRWLVVTRSLIIPDPLATYSVVYSPENEIVAASAAVIPGHLLKLDSDLNDVLDLPNTDHWYPFGLTPWRNVSRLLPNHLLDLQTFTASRIKPEVEILDDDIALAIASSSIKRTIAALSENYPVTILTTAGNDSRILLSAAKDVQDVKLLTFATSESSTDVQIAKELSHVSGFDHQVINVERNAVDETTWFHVVGQCVAGASLRSAALKLSLSPDQRYLKGVGGEIGRVTNYYRPGDEKRETIGAEALVRRLHLPNHIRLHQAATDWLRGLAGYMNVAELMEIVYRENRIGAWASPQLHGDSIASVWLYPFNNQETVDSLRFLSPKTKISRRAPRIIIDHLWPEMNMIAVNPVSTKKNFAKFIKHILLRLRRD